MVDVESEGAVGEGVPDEDHSFIVFLLEDDWGGVDGVVGVGVGVSFEGESDDEVFGGQKGGGGGGEECGIVEDGEAVEGVGVVSVHKECEDGSEADEPPGAAFPCDDKGNECEAEEDGEGSEGPFEATGKKDKGEPVGIMGPCGVCAIGDDGGSGCGEKEEDERQNHGEKDSLMAGRNRASGFGGEGCDGNGG